MKLLHWTDVESNNINTVNGWQSVTNQRLTLSFASESGGMLLNLFMVSISSLRSGWIWTLKATWKPDIIICFRMCSKINVTSSMALISSLSLSITVMNSWESKKGRECEIRFRKYFPNSALALAKDGVFCVNKKNWQSLPYNVGSEPSWQSAVTSLTRGKTQLNETAKTTYCLHWTHKPF